MGMGEMAVKGHCRVVMQTSVVESSAGLVKMVVGLSVASAHNSLEIVTFTTCETWSHALRPGSVEDASHLYIHL
jgi:hypothetical protein